MSVLAVAKDQVLSFGELQLIRIHFRSGTEGVLYLERSIGYTYFSIVTPNQKITPPPFFFNFMDLSILYRFCSLLKLQCIFLKWKSLYFGDKEMTFHFKKSLKLITWFSSDFTANTQKMTYLVCVHFLFLQQDS